VVAQVSAKALLILAIDFDGVLHDYKHPVKGRRMGAPIPGAKEAMQALRHNRLIIHTVRGDSPQHIEDWCKYYEIPYHEVTNIKPKADYYIDDHGIKFTNWQEVLPLLTNN